MEKHEIIEKICNLDATAQLEFLADFNTLELERHLKLLVNEARTAATSANGRQPVSHHAVKLARTA
jgi:hypothetical protein